MHFGRIKDSAKCIFPPGQNAKCKRFINVNNSETLECPGDQAKKKKQTQYWETQKSYELVARPGGSYWNWL